MYVVFALALCVAFIATITVLSHRLGQSKTENARRAALVGFLLSWLPPLALTYVAVLFLKEDVATV